MNLQGGGGGGGDLLILTFELKLFNQDAECLLWMRHILQQLI